MTGEERRQGLIHTIMEASQPVSGKKLAMKYEVSRQVIVQDIALLRAANYEILSTSKGYLMQKMPRVQKIITVVHGDEQIEDELNTIVDMGGFVLDVFVEHGVYGSLRAPMSIYSRKDVKKFMEKLATGESKPLNNLTSGIHSHTIQAYCEEDMEQIIEELKKKGYYLCDYKRSASC